MFTTSQRLVDNNIADDGNSEDTVPRPSTEKDTTGDDISTVDQGRGGSKSSTTSRSLENASVLPSVDVSPPYTQISTTSPTENQLDITEKPSNDVKEPNKSSDNSNEEISKMISNSVINHLDKKNVEPPADVTVEIESNSDITKPNINVDGINEVNVSVQIPNDSDESTEEIKRTKISLPKVPDTNKIDVNQLDLAVKELLDNFDTQKVSVGNADISEMITNSVIDHLDKNNLKQPDDITLLIKPNSNTSKPTINVDGVDEIEITVKIPGQNESKDETKKTISVPKVPGTNNIDVQKLDSAVKEVLEDFGLQEVSTSNEDISETISKSVMDHLDKNDLKTPNDLTVVINSNSDISKPKIKVDGIDEIEVDVQIPDENESNVETIRKISVPKAPGSDRIDVEKLDSAVKEVLEDFDSSKENEDTSEMISKSVMDHLDKNDLKTPNDLTVVVNSNSDISKPKIMVDGIDEIEVDVQIPDENETVKETRRKIPVLKVPGTDTIDIQQFNLAVRKVLDSSRKSETPDLSSKTFENESEIEVINTISQDITNAVIAYVNDGEKDIPENLIVDVVSEDNMMQFGSIQLEQTKEKEDTLKAKIKLNLDLEFTVPVPTLQKEENTIDKQELVSKLSEAFDKVVTDDSVNAMGKTPHLSWFFDYSTDSNATTINSISVDGATTLEMSEDPNKTSTPTESTISNELESVITTTKRTISVDGVTTLEMSEDPNKTSIPTESTISNELESVISTTKRTKVSSSTKDISEMIATSVMDHLDKNDLKHPDDITVVIEANSSILEPKIKVDGIDEIKVDIQIPNDNDKSLEKVERKIMVSKVPGTDTIDIQQLNAALKKILDDWSQFQLGSLSTVNVPSSEGGQSTSSNFNRDKSVNVTTLSTSGSSITTESTTLPIEGDGPTRIPDMESTVSLTESTTIPNKIDGPTQLSNEEISPSTTTFSSLPSRPTQLPSEEEVITSSTASSQLPSIIGGPTQLPDEEIRPSTLPPKTSGPNQLPSKLNSLSTTELTTSQQTTTDAITTTESSFFGAGVLDRVRDLAIALIAGLIAQSVGFPFSPSPAKKDDKEGVFVNVPTRPPLVNAKDPYIRKQVIGGEGAFDGNIFSLSIPVKPNEVDDLKNDEVRENLSTVVKEAFESIDPVDNIQVKEVDGKLIINAPYAGRSQLVTTARTTTDTRPKEPRFNDPIENEGSFIPIQATKRPPSEAEISTSPKVNIRPATNLPSNVGRDQPESVDPRTNPIDPNLQEDTTTRPIVSTSRRTAKPQVTTSKTIISPATNLPSSEVRDQPESIDPRTNRPFDPNYNLQGIEIQRPTTEKPILPEYVDNNGIYVVPPTIYSPGGEGEGGGFNTRPDIEDPDVYLRPVDPRLRGFGEPSVNIVEARVEELANTTRGSTIGVATISSITVGIIALLGFGLIIFMALARRRRRKYDATAASSANLTPTQSRTTFSGTPVMADTPSVSGGAWDDPLNTTGSSSIDPVVAIDGHQTIISSYNEFMSIPNDARNNIMHSLPSPQSSLEGGQHAPLSTSTPPLPGGPQNPGNNNASNSGHGPHTGQGGIPRTRDLIETSPFLFAPNLAGGNNLLHYHP